MSFIPLIPKEINNLMGRRKDEVIERVRKRRIILINLVITLVRERKSKKKVKFPCKLCSGDHLTHILPKAQDSHGLIAQRGPFSSHAVLSKPFSQGQKFLTIVNANDGTPSGGIQLKG